MSESNTPRLMAAAKEFNIGKDTLVDFLASKGFSKDDLKPTSKLTEDMYHSLQQEFSSDKAAKAKSDAIEIPKGSSGEAKKKKDEEEIVFKKDNKKKAEPEVVEQPALSPAPEPAPERPSRRHVGAGSNKIPNNASSWDSCHLPDLDETNWKQKWWKVFCALCLQRPDNVRQGGRCVQMTPIDPQQGRDCLRSLAAW